MQSSKQLRRITRLTSLTIALAVIFVLPSGYFLTAYSYEKKMLEEQSLIAADILSMHVYTHPQTWQFQNHRLLDILTATSWRRTHLFYAVYDAEGRMIVEVGERPEQPHHVRQQALVDNEQPVGLVEARTSLRPLLYKTGIAFVIALLVAFPVYYILLILPFKALSRVMKSLEYSQQKLKREIGRKKNALIENRKINSELRYRATHDSLTKLANRDKFYSMLQQYLSLAKNTGKGMTILLLDLNRFKDVNDSLGHQIGDKLLIEISKLLQLITPENGLLARLGGDEFAFVLTDTDLPDALHQAESITEVLRTHIVVDDYYIVTSASIGISCYPKHGDSQEVLLRNADIAMYFAKQASKPFALYDDSYKDNSPNRLVLTASLRHAIDNNMLSVNYQPIIELASGEVIGTEALCRWIDPQHGFISPDLFIPLAEQAGMINTLTDCVIESSLKQLAEWHKAGIIIRVSVNISARNLQNEHFPAQVKSLLEKYGIAPHFLNIEITESSMMINPEKSRELLNLMAEWGVKISIDDFGTGYSSLAYLKKLAVDELKIDRSFVMNMFEENDDRIIVQSTIELAHNLGMKVVAEGIENQETCDLLQQYGCDFVQGYHFSRPQTAEDIEQWIQARSETSENSE